MRTLPQIANDLGVSLDLLRQVVREDPNLATLAVRVGPARGFDAAAVKKIAAAMQERTALAGA